MHLVSPLPDKTSQAAENIRSSFACAPGVVDLETCLFRDGHRNPASSYIIRSAATGSRTIVNYNDLPEMSVDEFGRVLGNFERSGGGESCWHFEGRVPETTLQCIHMVRDHLPSAVVSVEVEKPGREGLTALAAEADMVFYSRSYALSTGATQSLFADWLHHQARTTARRARLLLVTCGADGAYVLQRGSECFQCPVQTQGGTVDVIDTIGAGDTFIAGVLYSTTLCHGLSYDARQCASFAVELASLKVGREGFGGLGAEMKDKWPHFFHHGRGGGGNM